MENKVIYLLRHLGAPQKEESISREYVRIIKEAEKHFGISIYQRPFGQKEMANHLANRFFFRFPRYKREDPKATKIGESVLLGIELSNGPFGDVFSPDPIYRFPSSLFTKKGYITKDELQSYEEVKPYEQRAVEFPGELFSACWVAKIHVKAAWEIAIALYNNQDLFNGANFLKSSQEKFYVLPGQLNQVIGDNSTARAGWEQTRLEDALFNTYKTIEAVLGDLPKDDNKFFNKLIKIGINPQEIVGYASKREVHSVIREINNDRDKKSAHGKTPNREIEIGSMLEYQACARFILISAIKNYLSAGIFS